MKKCLPKNQRALVHRPKIRGHEADAQCHHAVVTLRRLGEHWWVTLGAEHARHLQVRIGDRIWIVARGRALTVTRWPEGSLADPAGTSVRLVRMRLRRDWGRKTAMSPGVLPRRSA